MTTLIIVGALVYATLAGLAATIAAKKQRRRRAPQNVALHL